MVREESRNRSRRDRNRERETERRREAAKREKLAMMEELPRIDRALYVTMIYLCAFGLIMIMSASGGSTGLVKKQAFFIACGAVFMYIFREMNYNRLIIYAIPAYTVSLILILLLLTPLGINVNGATRWLGYQSESFEVSFQVAEVVKICVILMLGYLMQKFERFSSRRVLALYLWIAGGVPAVMLLTISNDLSSALIVLMITYGVSFVCTQTWKMHLAAFLAGAAVAVGYVRDIADHMPEPAIMKDISFRIVRIAVFLDPYRYAEDEGFQVVQALKAIGSGGLTGKGLGNSLVRNTLPEAHTDMIFCVLCEELGLIGVFALTALFVYLFYLLVRVTCHADSIFGVAIGTGVLAHIACQTLVNLYVNTNMLPNTGLPLPFISYGGTSVTLLMVEMTLAVSIEKHSMLVTVKKMQRDG